MSPEQKASRLFDIADQLDRARFMIEAANMACEGLEEGHRHALSVLLDEIATKVAMQAEKVRSAA